jgi:hypothetical protein
LKKDDLAMIVYSNSGKAEVKPSAIKMTDSSSLPKKRQLFKAKQQSQLKRERNYRCFMSVN